MTGRSQAGFTFVEALVSMAILSFALAGLAAVFTGSTHMNKAEQTRIRLRADARNCLTILENSLRSAGWDPRNAGLPAVALDPSPSGPDNYIETFADLNGDGDTADAGEDVTIRHHAGLVEWRTSSDVSEPFVPLAAGVTNDEDGDGTIEPMFTPDSTSAPTRITLKVTTSSSQPELASGRFLTVTLTSQVVLRSRL